MRIDLQPTEPWDRLNEALMAKHPLHEGEQVRFYLGTIQAAFEQTVGLAQIFSHRRQIAAVKGNSPAFDAVLPWLMREAYGVQSLPLADFSSEEQVQTVLQNLKKETLFVLFSEDNPVTGELWNFQTFDRALNDRKIFSIRVRHNVVSEKRDPLGPYSARILSVSASAALVESGSRWRVPPLLSNRHPLPTAEIVNESIAALSRQEDRALVESFEAQWPDQRVFEPGHLRVCDRAVLGFKDVGGEALLKVLGNRLGGEVSPLLMDTANLCRWDSTRLYKGWWQPLPAEETLRGMVCLSLEILRRKDFAKDLRLAYEEVKSLQSW